jgi:hypothetical protein
MNHSKPLKVDRNSNPGLDTDIYHLSGVINLLVDQDCDRGAAIHIHFPATLFVGKLNHQQKPPRKNITQNANAAGLKHARYTGKAVQVHPSISD